MPRRAVARNDDPVELNHLDSVENPVISVDCDGNILSRFHDRCWTFPASKIRKSSRLTVRWPDERGTNVISAKQLVHLSMTRGKAAALASVKTIALLAAFCADRGIEIRTLHRHPQVVIDFGLSQESPTRRFVVIAVARRALALREALGWTFLHHEQIAALEAINSQASKQYPVIPRRIHSELDNVANRILSGYLAVADQLEEVCKIWGPASMSKREGVANWQDLLSQQPLLANEFSTWSGESKTPLATYVVAIRSAACWVIAGGSCARKSEILALRRGCLSRERVGESIAYLLRGETTKTQNNSNAIWVVSPRLNQAIQALERLLDWYERTHSNPPNLTDYLFQVFDLKLGRILPPSQIRKGKLKHGEPIPYINFAPLIKFADTRITGDDWAEAKRFTPNMDERKFAVGEIWVPSTHQLRRTNFFYAAASDLVSLDSMSYQAKHQTWHQTSYYCQNFWLLANTDPDNPLVAGTRQSDAEEFTKIFADAYNLDRSSAMEDPRFFSPYGRDHKRSLISDTPLLSVDEIRTGLAHRVLKRNTLGLCAQAEFCPWQKAITVRGCMTKADGNVCAKAIIDADRERELRAIQEDLTFQLESLHARDTFAREQLEADIAVTASAISMIEQHKRGQDAEA